MGDSCSAGACKAGTLTQCADGNACSSDSCDALKGCVFVDNTEKCSDGNACTSGDSCSGGTCKGPAVNCDDSDACSVDYCDPASGCKHNSPPGFKGCGGQCANILTDPANCGDCGAKCQGGQLCLGGKCASIICIPNATTSCYSGPSGTAGVGACAAGKQTCNATGTALATACQDEVTPTTESCDTPADDNCDGKANPADLCGPGVYAFNFGPQCGSYCYYDEKHNIAVNGAGQGANNAGYDQFAFGQLLDGIKGADLWPADLGSGNAYEWVGWLAKAAVVTVKLPKTKVLTQVVVGMDNGSPPSDVAQPTEVQVQLSSDGISWSAAASFKKSDGTMATIPAFKRADVALKLAQPVAAQWVKLTFLNPYWTFLDELRFD